MTPLYTFGDAISLMRQGHRVTRLGWNGKGMYLELQIPTPLSKMTLPYIFMKTAQGDLVPWVASQSDILNDDWELVEQEEAPKRVVEREDAPPEVHGV